MCDAFLRPEQQQQQTQQQAAPEPEAPTNTSADKQASEEEARRRSGQSTRGLASTIVTSGLGLAGRATVGGVSLGR